MQSEQQSLVLQVVPPRSASNRDIAALETVMQGLALGVRHPVALELARTKRGRQFLLRATSPVALEHLAAQIQARYPQASIRPFVEDPLHVKIDEAITAVELQPGAASYLPLRSWRERELPIAGTDPLLGAFELLVEQFVSHHLARTEVIQDVVQLLPHEREKDFGLNSELPVRALLSFCLMAWIGHSKLSLVFMPPLSIPLFLTALDRSLPGLI